MPNITSAPLAELDAMAEALYSADTIIAEYDSAAQHDWNLQNKIWSGVFTTSDLLALWTLCQYRGDNGPNHYGRGYDDEVFEALRYLGVWDEIEAREVAA